MLLAAAASRSTLTCYFGSITLFHNDTYRERYDAAAGGSSPRPRAPVNSFGR
jgi:hypothetical protein